MKADIAVVGLAVMGENLVLNLERNGFRVAVFNRTGAKTEHFLAGRGKDKNIVGAFTPEELVKELGSPRIILMMVKAGAAVDATIAQLEPLLAKGDILVDGGNSFYQDTDRRYQALKEKGIRYVGMGVSGGEEGALNGPSMMPGGDPEAWEVVKPLFQKISAQVGDAPCCEWIGSGGAGHFSKTVHNGIEYGDMQIICEAYQLMRDHLGMSVKEIGAVFDGWQSGPVASYLIEITAAILAYEDEQGAPLVNQILDKAGQKGTGKWTVISALDYGIPLTLIAEAVMARALSAQKTLRVKAASMLPRPEQPVTADRAAFLEDLGKAVYAAKICSYAQGFALLKEASVANAWDMNYSSIARIWRGGCIIRSVFLDDIAKAFEAQPELESLLLAPYFTEQMDSAHRGWRRVVAAAVGSGIPVPAMSSALAYYDGLSTALLPANLLQAQRDYFGAHMYQRLADPDGPFVHTDWTGHGGDTASGTYTV